MRKNQKYRNCMLFRDWVSTVNRIRENAGNGSTIAQPSTILLGILCVATGFFSNSQKRLVSAAAAMIVANSFPSRRSDAFITRSGRFSVDSTRNNLIKHRRLIRVITLQRSDASTVFARLLFPSPRRVPDPFIFKRQSLSSLQSRNGGRPRVVLCSK